MKTSEFYILRPSIAIEIGEAKAAILEKIAVYCGGKAKSLKGECRKWICNSISSWKIQHFQDWSESKVYRAIKSLEKQGLIRSKKEVHKQGYYLEENIKLQELYVRKVGDNYQNQLTTIKIGVNE
jgi:hypothetical protein